jgi:hypothetical protein
MDAPFPAGASEGDWRHSRSRKADDVNAEVREAVDRDGYSPSAESNLPPDHVAVSLHESRSRSVNLFRSHLT